MSRDFSHPAHRTCHLGKSGTGKSTDFVHRLKKEMKTSKFIFIFDHKREFSTKLKIPVQTNEAQLAEALSKKGIVCFDHHELSPHDRLEAFRVFCDWVYSMAKALPGRKILVFDEGQEVAGPLHDPVELIQCLDDGRSLKLDCKFIAQSLNGLHTDVRAQLTEIYCFRHEDRNGISHLNEKGINAELIQSLRPGEFIWKNLNTGQAAKGGRAFQLVASGIPDGSRPL
jgi:hypothetical protein